jgi:DNA-binding CsgD family transcriptional regulator
VGKAIHSDYEARILRLVSAQARSINAQDFGRDLILRFRNFFGFSNTAFVLLDTANFVLSYPVFGSIPRSSIERHRAVYRDEGIFLRAMMQERKLLSRKFITATDIMSRQNYDLSLYYQDIVRPADAYDSALIPFAGRGAIRGMLAIFKPAQDGLFTELERKALSLLSDPVGALFESHLEFLSLRSETAIDESIFSGLDTGVIVVDQDNQVIRMNSVAERFCKRLYSGDATQAVRKFLATLWESGRIGKQKADSITDLDGSKVDVKVLPMSHLTPLQNIAFRYVIYLRNTTDKEEQVGRLVDRYSLSKRELEIILRIVEGEDNVTIADKLFLSEHTVRTHLQNIYRKLSISNRISIIHAFRALS